MLRKRKKKKRTEAESIAPSVTPTVTAGAKNVLMLHTEMQLSFIIPCYYVVDILTTFSLYLRSHFVFDRVHEPPRCWHGAKEKTVHLV